MSIHVPWAEEAQLTEVETNTNFVGPLRDCVRHYASMPASVQANALILADAAVPLPGRTPTRVLEHSELQTLIAAFGVDEVAGTDIAGLIARRSAP